MMMVLSRSMSTSAKAAARVAREATVPTLASATSLHGSVKFLGLVYNGYWKQRGCLTARSSSTLAKRLGDQRTL